MEYPFKWLLGAGEPLGPDALHTLPRFKMLPVDFRI